MPTTKEIEKNIATRMALRNISAVCADGGVVKVNPSPYAGVWAFCHLGPTGGRVLEVSGVILPKHVEGPTVSNNMAEYFALLRALEYLPDGWSGDVMSDSGVTLGRFFDGWKNAKIPHDWFLRLGMVFDRIPRAGLRPVQLDGHPTAAQLAAGIGKRGNLVHAANVWCDAACKREAERFIAAHPLMLGTGMPHVASLRGLATPDDAIHVSEDLEAPE